MINPKGESVMMKTTLKYIPIAMAVTCGLILLSCGAAPNEPGRYYSPDYHFSIKYPPGWQISIEPLESTVSFWEEYKNDRDMYQEAITVTYQELILKTSVETYYYHVIQSTYKEMIGWRIESEGDVTLDGQPAKAVRGTLTFEGYPLKVIGYVVIKGKHALTIACFMEPEKYDQYHGIFKDAVRSIRFE
jgi:hypothetical protein